MTEIIEMPFDWNDNFSEIAQEDFSMVQQPKTGHWINELGDWNRWTCSECGYTKRTDIHVRLGYNFCPKCGARMVEPQAESAESRG